MEGDAHQREWPFLCRVAIDDDQGKTWIAELRGWCAPERSERDLLRVLWGA